MTVLFLGVAVPVTVHDIAFHDLPTKPVVAVGSNLISTQELIVVGEYSATIGAIGLVGVRITSDVDFTKS